MKKTIKTVKYIVQLNENKTPHRSYSSAFYVYSYISSPLVLYVYVSVHAFVTLKPLMHWFLVSVSLFCEIQTYRKARREVRVWCNIFQSVICMTREAGNTHENGLSNSESQHEHVTPSSSCHSAPATITVETSKGKNRATGINFCYFL